MRNARQRTRFSPAPRAAVGGPSVGTSPIAAIAAVVIAVVICCGCDGVWGGGARWCNVTWRGVSWRGVVWGGGIMLHEKGSSTWMARAAPNSILERTLSRDRRGKSENENGERVQNISKGPHETCENCFLFDIAVSSRNMFGDNPWPFQSAGGRLMGTLNALFIPFF